MSERGLEPVANPSQLFMGDRTSQASGSAVTALLEGTRPVLVEVQALAAKAGFGTPQRVATGFDARRLALLLAVLDKRVNLSFAQLDVFLNVVGGVQLREPSGDLAVAAALASSVYDRPLPNDAVFVGEVGLGGEVRAVSQIERRIAEAANLGMRRVYLARTRGAEARESRRRARRRADAARPHAAPVLMTPRQPATSASSSLPAGAARERAAQELKQFRWVAGKPALLHSLQTFMARPDVVSVVVVLPREYAADPPPWVFQCDIDRLMISTGGRSRTESVANGLEDLPDEASVVLIHDAARPLVERRHHRARDRGGARGPLRDRRAAGRRHAEGSGRVRRDRAHRGARAVVARANAAGVSARGDRARASRCQGQPRRRDGRRRALRAARHSGRGRARRASAR